MRRSLVAAPALAVALAVHATYAAAQSQQPAELRITFLGTSASPAPPAAYAGPATLVEFGSELLLIDVGRGAVQRLQQANINPGLITAVFLTHLHSDHTVGLPELWLTGWWSRRRQAPLEVRGPEGTEAMTAAIERAWSYDVSIRSGPPEHVDPKTAALVARDVQPGVVFDRNGVRVTAIEVDHGPVRTFGYRIDAGGRSVVFSGDDRASENLIAASRDVDVLVHSILAFTPEELADTTLGPRRRAALELLGTPEQVGSLFANARPKLAVYYHYIRHPAIAPRTRVVYSGPLEFAEDLMRIAIGDQIVVQQPRETSAPVATAARQPPAELSFACTTTFPATLAADDLIRRFGAQHVVTDSLYVGEGLYERGTVLFPADSSRRVEIFWKDADAQRSPDRIRLTSKARRWTLPSGIEFGTSLKELERKNGRPFRLAGFAFDRSGTATSWSGGALDHKPGEPCLTRVRLDPTVPDERSRRSYNQVQGDRNFSSGHPAMQALNPVVVEVWLDYR